MLLSVELKLSISFDNHTFELFDLAGIELLGIIEVFRAVEIRDTAISALKLPM
jgi:hypothetical protein